MILVRFVAATTLCLFAHIAVSAGLSGLSVSPTRILLDDGARSGAVTLRNTSQREVSYRVSVIEMGIDGDGKVVPLALDEQPEGFSSLAPYIRFSPRQVRLEPGASQVIRVLLMRGATVSDGEFRSHLEIRALPEVPSVAIEQVQRLEDLLHAPQGLVTRLGVTLPIVWRRGVTTGGLSVASIELHQSGSADLNAISLTLERHGSRSVFGDFTVSLLMASGERREVAWMRDYGLFYPYAAEKVRIPAHGVSEADLASASGVHVLMLNDETDNGPAVLIDHTFPIPRD